MKTAVVFLCLAAAAMAKPHFVGFGGGATGGANAGSTLGQTSGLFGNSQILRSGASAGGSAFNGGSSFNSASSTAGQSNGFLGQHQFANNQAQSNQFGGGFGGLGGFGGFGGFGGHGGYGK